MGILGWILFGLIIGVLAKVIMPGKDPGGIIITMLLGVAGSLLGGWFGRVIGLYNDYENGAGFIMSILGAIVLLGIYRAAIGRRSVRA